MKNKINMIIQNTNLTITKFLLQALLLVISYIPLILVADQSLKFTQPPLSSNKEYVIQNNNLTPAEINRNLSLTNNRETNINIAYDQSSYQDNLATGTSQEPATYRTFNAETYTRSTCKETIALRDLQSTENRHNNLFHRKIYISDKMHMVIVAFMCLSIVAIIVLVTVFIIAKK